MSPADEMFTLRVERWRQELRAGIAGAYADVDSIEARLLSLAERAYAERDPDLRRLDLRRMLEPDWFQQPGMLGYAAYADRFAGTLGGVAEQVGYLRGLGVTYLHLMPLLAPRPGANDGGYAVADFRTVRPDLGTMDDLRGLAKRLRDQGVSLVLDLVLNHVAREHAWAEAARAGDPKYRAYFHLFPDRELPDAYERTLPEVFPDFAPGNFTWDDDLDAWVWTTFNSYQWDMNWANPDVLLEYAEIVLFLANAGVEVLRLDAIAFLSKRLGTNSQNQPEVHAIVQTLRALARIVCPALLFKAEAIVGPRDLVAYLGAGEHYGKVSDLAYHNSLMVQFWSMIAARDVRLASVALRGLPAKPPGTSWITYLRCHDDIGWAIDDADAGAAGLSGAAHRAFLSDFYAGYFPETFADGLVFQENVTTGDRRISGSAASLAGIDATGGVARLLLGHALILGWGGLPVLWMGDELGLPNDPHWADDPAHAEDNRWVHRPRMDWAKASRPGRLYEGISHLAQVRARLPHLHASIEAEVLDLSDPGILPIRRQHPTGELLGLYNVTPEWRAWPGYRLDGLHRDAISGDPVTPGDLWLAPYRAVWLV